MSQLIRKGYLAISAILLLSCSGNNSNKQTGTIAETNGSVPETIISDKPIKSEILGLKLGEAPNAFDIHGAICGATKKMFTPSSQRFKEYYTFRYTPDQPPFYYGGIPWHYIDIDFNNDEQIVRVTLMGSFESLDQAKKSYDQSKNVLTKKYGKGNEGEEGDSIYWTDTITTVGAFYYQGNTIYGQDRSFCGMFYVNNMLGSEIEAAMEEPDV